jgi:hypothetical protein
MRDITRYFLFGLVTAHDEITAVRGVKFGVRLATGHKYVYELHVYAHHTYLRQKCRNYNIAE